MADDSRDALDWELLEHFGEMAYPREEDDRPLPALLTKRKKALTQIVRVRDLARFLGCSEHALRHELDRGAVERAALPKPMRRRKGQHWKWLRADVLKFYAVDDG